MKRSTACRSTLLGLFPLRGISIAAPFTPYSLEAQGNRVDGPGGQEPARRLGGKDSFTAGVTEPEAAARMAKRPLPRRAPTATLVAAKAKRHLALTEAAVLPRLDVLFVSPHDSGRRSRLVRVPGE